MRVIGFITEPSLIMRILDHIRRRDRVSPPHPDRAIATARQRAHRLTRGCPQPQEDGVHEFNFLTPNDFNSLTALEKRLLDFQLHYQAVAKPFQWRFTRRDLEALLDKLATRPMAA